MAEQFFTHFLRSLSLFLGAQFRKQNRVEHRRTNATAKPSALGGLFIRLETADGSKVTDVVAWPSETS